jgi:hypothetical protein
MTTPVPGGRGRWRFTVHHRVYNSGQYPADTQIAEITDARSRKLTQAWNKSAQLTFTLDGHSPSAMLVAELTTDVMAWRWDDETGRDVAMFRGIVAQTQDTLTEQAHTVNVTCHDYLAVMARRFWTGPQTGGWANLDQDLMVNYVTYWSCHIRNGDATTLFDPGSWLPLQTVNVDPAGVSRGLSGQLRTRVFAPQSTYFDAIALLAADIGGFDFQLVPGGNSSSVDLIRVYYPNQGVQRTTPQLVYGPTVSALTRSFNSQDYANYQRLVGNSGTATPGALQLYSEAWNSDANNVTVAPQGTWMTAGNASDISVQATLDDRVQGNLTRSQVVVPTYTLTLRPGVYRYGWPNMGDTVPLVVQSGRLNVDTTIRVLGFDYAIGDDGQEDVQLTVGRPDVTLTNLFTRTNADVNALARR